MAPPAPPAGVDLEAFHAYLDEVNARRAVPLSLTIMVLLGIAAVAGFVRTGRVDPTQINVLGVWIGVLTLAMWRWSSSRRLLSNLFGWGILGYGLYSANQYTLGMILGQAERASDNFAVHFVTRFLAALSMIWRPLDLAVALGVAHGVASLSIAIVSPWNAFLFGPIWIFVAWLSALLIYRAERDAFHARAVLQQQRDDLAEANVRLAQMNQEKNDLMAIAAHDLRSPLMGIVMLLKSTVNDASRAWAGGVERLKAIEQSCRDMADLVSRVLDVHATEERLEHLDLRAGDVHALVRRTVESHAPGAAAKGIALVLDGAAPCVALHDEHALARVLDNLVSNAVKFTPPGGRVRVTVEDNGARPLVAVSDSGPGIGPEDRARLFRKFSRLRARPTAGESSSGLGLYITKRLTDAMGGSISVSDASPGVTFTVSLRPDSA